MLAAGRGGSRGGEVGGVGPATDGEEDLELAVSLLEEEELLDAAVDIGPRVVPGVGRIVLVRVRPGIGQVAVKKILENNEKEL